MTLKQNFSRASLGKNLMHFNNSNLFTIAKIFVRSSTFLISESVIHNHSQHSFYCCIFPFLFSSLRDEIQVIQLNSTKEKLNVVKGFKALEFREQTFLTIVQITMDFKNIFPHSAAWEIKTLQNNIERLPVKCGQ